MEILKIVILSLSGLLLFAVGTMRLFNPIKAYLKGSGIKLDNGIDLLNEMRGVGAVMLGTGVVILLGTCVSGLAVTSHSFAVLVFLGFALGRTIGLATDGKPNKQLIQGLVSELVLGGANVVCLISTL